MLLCYTVEQLLLLRTSPLVCKPEDFPPLEEWMGTPQEQKQRGLAPSRGRLDDHTNQSEQSQRRPSLIDTHHISKRSSTAPEDIILGPPKTAFASANSRNAPRSSGADTSEETPASTKRFSVHERLPRDRDSVDGEKKEGKYNGVNNRRQARDDREDWQSSRQQRHYDQEEGDRGSRRNGDRDRPRWEKQCKDKDSEGGADTKRLSRDAGRREGRGRFEQPWFRGDKVQEGVDEATKSSTKQNEWRREKGSGRGAEWDRPSKADQDPEWMDATGANEPRPAHTQEEFQRWKEGMKAAAEGRDKISERQEMIPQPEIKKPEPPPMPAFLEIADVESGMDKFFASYGERKTSSEQKPAEVKAHRKPRFAALFSPQPEDGLKDASLTNSAEMTRTSMMLVPEAATAPVDANKADQEHFQRVLQMLAGRSSNNTPQSGPAPKPSKHTANLERPQRAPEEQQSILVDFLDERNQAKTQGVLAEDRVSIGKRELLSPKPNETQPRVPREPTPNRDADFLLRLMQQSKIAQDSEPSQVPKPEASRSTTESLPLPGSISRQLPVDRTNNNPPTFFDDPAISQMHRPDQAPTLPRRESQQRRPTNGPTPAFFDEPFFHNLRQVNQQAMANADSGTTQPRAPTLPPGMQRPPGFEHIPAPLPGWQNPVARAMNSAYAPGPPLMQPPPHQQIPPQQRQRKYTGDGFGPGWPVGTVPPPPGFMGAPPPPGPPPGFPNMPPLGGGVRGVVVGPAGQPFGEAGNGMLPRHVMEMLASGQRGDGREGGGGGGGGMPGAHYR
ncbi:hypothetical protein GJ744_002339 [Endocarpon pusillum]|uniref:Uncharacterized protein n=1 Tax=Endocarpon pusillum TaxID=364733 RepID=A0A8H7AQ38_9EURO|nr:hypothetical protein GJ744_002339 [Endocarpon pusillum]